jgi:hypothetical protein
MPTRVARLSLESQSRTFQWTLPRHCTSQSLRLAVCSQVKLRWQQFLVAVLLLVIPIGTPSNALAIISGRVNVPPTALGANEEVGQYGIVNIYDNGRVPASLDINYRGVVNVYGGELVGAGEVTGTLNVYEGEVEAVSWLYGWQTGAYRTGTLNVFGGVVGSVSYVGDGMVNVSGGVVRILPGSVELDRVSIYGGEFSLNGMPISGLEEIGTILQLEIPRDSYLTGVLTDGTPFCGYTGFHSSTKVSVHSRPLPPVDQIVINAEPATTRQGARRGQTIVVADQGRLRDSFRAGSGSVIELDGGTVGSDFVAFDAIVNVRNGSIGRGFQAYLGSKVTISGGVFDAEFHVGRGAEAIASGGSFGSGISSQPGSRIELVGGEFRVDGELIPWGDQTASTRAFDIPEGAIFSGTLADGSPFTRGSYAAGTLRLTKTQLPTYAPSLDVSSVSNLAGLRNGQSLRLFPEGKLPNYFSAGWQTQIEVLGGVIGNGLHLVGGSVHLREGIIGSDPCCPALAFEAVADSHVVQTGGAILSLLSIGDGSRADVSGGSASWVDLRSNGSAAVSGSARIGTLRAFASTKSNVSGGTITKADVYGGQMVMSAGRIDTLRLWGSPTAEPAGDVFISGGTVKKVESRGGQVHIAGGDSFVAVSAEGQGVINLYGPAFAIDGVAITPGTPGKRKILSISNNTLSGVFVDGANFSWRFRSQFGSNFYVAPRSAVLAITFLLPGDFDLNGIVDSSDFSIWQSANGTSVSTPGSGADGNFDGVVDDLDRKVWFSHRGLTFADFAIAEPNTAALLYICVGVVLVAKSNLCLPKLS